MIYLMMEVLLLSIRKVSHYFCHSLFYEMIRAPNNEMGDLL